MGRARMEHLLSLVWELFKFTKAYLGGRKEELTENFRCCMMLQAKGRTKERISRRRLQVHRAEPGKRKRMCSYRLCTYGRCSLVHFRVYTLWSSSSSGDDTKTSATNNHLSSLFIVWQFRTCCGFQGWLGPFFKFAFKALLYFLLHPFFNSSYDKNYNVLNNGLDL